MKLLGFRCSSNDYTYALLERGSVKPKVIETKTIPFPKGYSRPRELKWLYLEIVILCKQTGAKGILIKKAEPSASKGKPFSTRIENEAMILLVAGMLNIKFVCNKVKVTILKDLGHEGRSKNFPSACDEVLFDYTGPKTEKMYEAIMVARSGF